MYISSWNVSKKYCNKHLNYKSKQPFYLKIGTFKIVLKLIIFMIKYDQY